VEDQYDSMHIPELVQVKPRSTNLMLLLPDPPLFEHVNAALDKVDVDLYCLVEDFLRT
jgi:hypothetical protein